MEMLSALLAICEGNPLVSIGFLLTKDSDVEHNFILMGYMQLALLQAQPNDIMTWKGLLHYWPFVRGIQKSAKPQLSLRHV